MKYLVKFIVLTVTWPLLLLILIIGGFLWLGFYCWGSKKAADEIEIEILDPIAYCLWHFRTKES